jgi:hypothetical protein
LVVFLTSAIPVSQGFGWRNETLWLMLEAQPLLEVEISGVAAVQFLAGYPGCPGQSRMFSGITAHGARRSN